MESQKSNGGGGSGGGGSGCGWGKVKISLDDYLSFLDSDNKSHYSNEFINQIIRVHGFRKIYKTHKSELLDIVKSIDTLMNDPNRRTLREPVTPSTPITLKEANADLKTLDWFDCPDCCVTSIQIQATALTSCCQKKTDASKSQISSSKDLVLFQGELQQKTQGKYSDKGNKLMEMDSSPEMAKKRARVATSGDELEKSSG